MNQSRPRPPLFPSHHHRTVGGGGAFQVADERRLEMSVLGTGWGPQKAREEEKRNRSKVWLRPFLPAPSTRDDTTHFTPSDDGRLNQAVRGEEGGVR